MVSTVKLLVVLLIMASSRLQTPVYKKGKSYEVYRNQVLLWREVTEVDKEKQGIFIYLSLPDDAESKIKERVLDELTIEDLKKSDGLDKLIEIFDKHLKKDDIEDEWSKYNIFDDFSRSDELGIDDYVSEFDSLYNKLKNCKIVIPPQILAFRLLKKANISKDEALLVMSGLDYADKPKMYDQAKKSLKKFKGDGAAGVSGRSCESDVLVARGTRYVPPMFRNSSRQSTPQSQYTPQSQSARWSKPSVMRNRAGLDGRTMRCRGCDSVAHLIRDCPHVPKTSQAHFTDVDEFPESFDETVCLFSVEESHVFLAEATGSIVLDTGCTATVCGDEWLDVYLASLSADQRSSVILKSSNKTFKFGAGASVPSLGVCSIPGTLVGRSVLITTDVVKSGIPLLLSRSAMKRAAVKIDTSTDKAVVFGTEVDLDTTSSGHYSLPIQEREFEVCALELGTKESEKKATLLKLHRQFAHPTTPKLLSLLKDAGISQAQMEESTEILNKVREDCDVCKQFAATPPRPAVCMPMADRFNQKVAMDLKKWDDRWILHLVCMWSRLTLSVFVNRKKPSEIIDKIMRHWVAHFGLMGSIMHDNGGEFSNDEMRAVCSTLNVEVITSAAQSPWQNGLCERVHAVTDTMLLKLTADYPKTAPEILLCWANMARNAMQMWNGFSSYQLVFGINPNVPNVMTDRLPALDARTSTKIFNDHLNALHAARRAFVQSESEERIRRALRCNVRTSEERYVHGDQVYYKRDQSPKWLGPAKVMFQDGKVIFVRHGGIIVRVSPNRIVKRHKSHEERSSDPDCPKRPADVRPVKESDDSASDTQESEEESEATEEDQGKPEEPKAAEEKPTDVPEEKPTESEEPVDPVESVPTLFVPEEVAVQRQSLRLLNKEHDWEVYYSTVSPVHEWQVYMNEVPKNLHDNPECIQAKEEELNKLLMFEVYVEVEDQGQACIGTRWVLTYKGASVKARLVAKGFQEKEKVPSDSPTVAKTARRALMAIAASKDWTITTTDIKSAFLQGKDLEREIYVKPPKEARAARGIVWRLKKTLYGLNDGSRQFYFSVCEFLLACGCKVSSVDPSVFFYFHDEQLVGILVSHVDDFLHAGSDVFEKNVMGPLRERFIAGKVEKTNFRYVGFSVMQSTEGIKLSMDEYVENIVLKKIIPGSDNRPLDKEEKSEYRSLVGRLNWIAQGSRPDKAFDVIELSTKFQAPTLSDMNRAIKVAWKVRDHRSVILFPRLRNYLSLQVYADVSSTMGLVVFDRVFKSTLAAEALALQEGVNESVYLQKLFSEMGLEVSIHAYSDSRSLVEALHSTKLVSDRRLRIDIGALKQSLQREVTAVHWCPGRHQLADVLTKRGADGAALLRAFQTGKCA